MLDEEIVEQLIKMKGIGRWTSERRKYRSFPDPSYEATMTISLLYVD
jgi:3-methyladenine DNA glycosylase/8-oxoguanine DNA glycosylase